MASEINLTVGSLVSFTSTIAREFYEGRVYFYDPKDASFGIDNVSRTNVSGGYRRVEGCYQFSLKDIKDLRVIREPKLIVGPLVSFTSMTAGEFYQGTVYFYNSKDASFGIDDGNLLYTFLLIEILGFIIGTVS
ncbi:unnamed protein product [Arabis nemorensis]|uniref:Uncharacterized protein n=1 Tax=Arabis nemorensis TaxID=586526 RepID=A0A565AX85_9BRAS|nr:unnamed protein product [Arabis nemorensis]